jgi:hypothetical protein
MPAKTNKEIVKFLRALSSPVLVPVRFVAVVMHDDQLIEPIANSQGHWLLDDGNTLTYAMERPVIFRSTISVCGPT